jgi:hypothetical protein
MTLVKDDTGEYYTGAEKCELCGASHEMRLKIPYGGEGLVFICYRCNFIITQVRTEGGILAEYGCRYASTEFIVVKRHEFDDFMNKIKPPGAYEKLTERLVLDKLSR